MALARLEREISGTAEERIAASAAREKEARIEAIAKRAVQRIKNGGLLRGWTTWFEGYCEKVRRQRMLASSVARMQRPLLVATVSKWKYDWGDAELSAGRRSASNKQASRAVAEVRAETQERLNALEQALAEEKEEGRQRLHRLKLELTGSASEQLAAQQVLPEERAAAPCTRPCSPTHPARRPPGRRAPRKSGSRRCTRVRRGGSTQRGSAGRLGKRTGRRSAACAACWPAARGDWRGRGS